MILSVPTLRPARISDAAAMYEVWYRAEPEPDKPSLSRDAWRLGYFEHVVTNGGVLVATDRNRLVGFAALLERSGVVYLSDLFVNPASQSSGIGRRFLTEILAGRTGVICTLSSTDPRALPLYVRAGMRPAWPNLWLLADSNALAQPEHEGVRVEEADPGNGDLIGWDAELSGRVRPMDHGYWRTVEAGTPLWLVRDDQRIGYGYVRLRNPLALWNPYAATVGPVGVQAHADAVPSVAALVSWAAQRSAKLRVALPGPHPAFRMLLEAGFRVVDQDIFLSTDPALIDPERYVTAGDLL
jgi:GNAT superfamily N-acetyltransferase